MAWKLKDKKLEAELNRLSGGEFSRRLNEVVKSGASSIRLTINDGKVAIFLDGRDLEQVPDYNPSAWNEYPTVTPPEGVLMRAEVFYPDGVYRECVIFEDGVWQKERNGKSVWDFRGRVKRFRPWEG